MERNCGMINKRQQGDVIVRQSLELEVRRPFTAR